VTAARSTRAEPKVHLAAASRWIMDGDLGSHDAPAARLGRADTVLVLDFSLARCACALCADPANAPTSGGGC
jgi:hypothetical protein